VTAVEPQLEGTAELPETPSHEGRTRTMSVRGATFLGIGSMIGAGIFALLGEAGAIAGAAVWLSFLIAEWLPRCSVMSASSSGAATPRLVG
jgi:amino acid transporter